MKTSCFLLSLLFILGCKKKDISYDVTGTVSDGTAGNSALGGVSVTLYAKPTTGSYTYMSSTTTSSDGKYSFHIDREKIESYKLVFNKDLYFDHEQNFTYDDASAQNSSAFSATLYSKGWVKLRFVTGDPSSNLSVTRNAGKSGCSECCGNNYDFSGITDTTIFCVNNGGATYGYYWFRNNGASHGDTSIVTPKGDTVTLLLNY